MKKNNRERPQYGLDKRSHVSLEDSRELVREILQSAMPDPAAYRRHLHYQQLLLHCLPPIWHHRVFFMRIEGGRWHIAVGNSGDGFKLRFLLPEIEAQLGEHLGQVPKLQVHTNPRLWQLIPQSRQEVKVRSARELTREEAQRLIDNFLKRI